jgi:hypothetical protein
MECVNQRLRLTAGPLLGLKAAPGRMLATVQVLQGVRARLCRKQARRNSAEVEAELNSTRPLVFAERRQSTATLNASRRRFFPPREHTHILR